MRVNKLPFLVSISRKIKFGTSEFLADQKKTTLCKAIMNVVNLYKGRGFTINTVLADGQFEPIEHPMRTKGVPLNTVSNNEQRML